VDELVKAIILPSHTVAILGFLGFCFLAVKRLRRKGTYLLVAGVSVYLVFSNGIVAAGLIGPLEYRYPPLLKLNETLGVHTAVVLTSFATDDLSMPLSSRAGPSAAYRVLEALRLYADGRVTEILISGDATAAAIMAELLSGCDDHRRWWREEYTRQRQKGRELCCIVESSSRHISGSYAEKCE